MSYRTRCIVLKPYSRFSKNKIQKKRKSINFLIELNALIVRAKHRFVTKKKKKNANYSVKQRRSISLCEFEDIPER